MRLKAEEVPLIIRKAWHVIDEEEIIAAENLSRLVSTNAVYLIHLKDKKQVIAKASSYGSFEHFIEDHIAISNWARAMQGSEYSQLLAMPLEHQNEFFAYKYENLWVTFYKPLENIKILPSILNEIQIKSLGREMAKLHNYSEECSTSLMKPAKSLETDVMVLWRSLENEYYVDSLFLTASSSDFLKQQCETLLQNLEKVKYQRLKKLPVLVDWNLGNFSVSSTEGEFQINGRWDYDWFRFEPAVMDFYFLSRVVRAEGDKTNFRYSPNTLVEDRFQLFLSEYSKIRKLSIEELRFLKEAYRFFILNYVIKDGQNFFRDDIYQRLREETINEYLVELKQLNLEDKSLLSSLDLH